MKSKKEVKQAQLIASNLVYDVPVSNAEVDFLKTMIEQYELINVDAVDLAVLNILDRETSSAFSDDDEIAEYLKENLNYECVNNEAVTPAELAYEIFADKIGIMLETLRSYFQEMKNIEEGNL